MQTCAVCGYQAAEAFKFCPECGAAAAPSGQGQRKVVTVLFCDVVGSTALGESIDPEALRALLVRYFERMKAVVERHGGVVEKFIGDAVMAVFGIPAVHEDDALRALRAAEEMRQALPELGVEGRIGVTTGEVVTGTEERLATGDAVNVAARLQQAARPGEILIGETSLRLAGEAARAEPVEPLPLKGKSKPVAAWRLLAVSAIAPERSLDSPLIGRESELSALFESWERVRAERRCELVTVVGDAGVGKSRLVSEFLASAKGQVVRGRCLSYGEGITYWPVVEVLKQLGPRADALDLDSAATVALDALLGRDGTTSTDEIAWAFRKLLEAVAAEEPVIAVFDDIHWGEEVFLDLLEHIALLSTSAPILVLCMARPELLDQRAGWASVIRLGPLEAEQAKQLLEARLSSGELKPGARERVLAGAGGNPLFVEEMAAMVQVSGNGDVEVPPTIQALLAARLDQLGRAERTVLEHGAIEGEIFHRGVVQALTPQEDRLTARLTALVRRELVRPDKPALAGDDAFRFRHLLLRDAAYEATPKAARSELHEQFADWLERHGRELVELDEILGHHLERAWRYRAELGPLDERGRTLAKRAGERLRAAGMRAVERADFRAGATLLERAALTLGDQRPDPRVEVALAWARFNIGLTSEARMGLEGAIERAERLGDRVVALALGLDKATYENLLEPTVEAWLRLRRAAEEAQPIFEETGDEWAQAGAAGALLVTEDALGSSRAAVAAAASHVVEHAQRAGDRIWLDFGESQIASAHFFGATSVADCLQWLDQHVEIERRYGAYQRPALLAMLGRHEEARRLFCKADARLQDRGAVRSRTILLVHRAGAALLEFDPASAAEAAREACDLAEATGGRDNFEWFCSVHAQALLEVGRDDEAEAWLDRGRQMASNETIPQVLRRRTRAKLLARRGQFEEAERLALEAVEVAEQTDMLNLHADALLGLADVLILATKDPRAELEQARALYERKGNLVMVERTRAGLAAGAAPGARAGGGEAVE